MNRSCGIILLTCLLLFSVSLAARRSRYRLIWHSFDCKNEWPETSNLSCKIGPENKDNLNVNVQILRHLKDVWCRYKVLIPRPTQSTEMVLFDAAIDVCLLLKEGVLKNKMTLNIFHNIVRESNLVKMCPIKQGPLYFHNISALDNFPAFLPETDFTVTLIFYKPNTTYFVDLTLKGTILENTKARNKMWH